MADRHTPGSRAVITAGLAAQLSVATVGALPWPVLPVVAVGYVVAAEAASRASAKRSEALRHGGTALALICVVALAPLVLGSDDRSAVKQALGLMLIGAQIGQAMGWRAVRDVKSGLFASLGLMVLSASYAPDVLIGIPLLVGWVALVAGLALVSGIGRVEAARAAAAAVALGLVGFLLIPVEPTAGARNRLNALATAGAGERLPTDLLSTSQMDLRTRGNLSTAGLVRVPEDSPQLWRAISFDDYDGVRWTRRVQRTRLPGDGPVFEVSPSSLPTRTDRVERVGRSQLSDGTVWSPGAVVSVTAPMVSLAIADDKGDVQLPAGARTYEVTSVEPVTDPTLLAGDDGPDPGDPRWLALPSTLPSRVADLAREVTAGSGTRFESAERIADHLRGRATYRLDSPVPLPGEDAVDRFLFVDRTGFCEQFASAEVVMLRSLGIPARLVTGLAYGVDDPDDDSLRLFRVADLHAWVELWVPGAGWVRSDPTAGVELASGGPGAGVRRQVATWISSGLRELTRVPGGRTTLAVLLGITGLLAVTLIGRRTAAVVGAGPTSPAGPALAAFLRLDERLGARRRRDAESLREMGQRLDPALAQALGVVERECYGPGQPEPAEVRAAVAVLDRATAPGPAAPGAPRGPRAGRERTPRRG